MKASTNPALTGFITNLSGKMTETDMLEEVRFFQAMNDRHERIEKASANALGKRPALYRGLLDSDMLLEEVNDGSIEDTREPRNFIPTEELTEADLSPLYLALIEAEEEPEDETKFAETDAVADLIEAYAFEAPAKNEPADQYEAFAREYGVTDAVADRAYARVRNGNDYLVVVPKGHAKKSVANLDTQDGFEEKYGDDFGPACVSMRKASGSCEKDHGESYGSPEHRAVNIYRRQKRLPKGGDTVRRDPTLPVRVAAVPNVASIGPKGVAKAVAKQFGVKIVTVHGFSVIAD